MSNSVTKKFYFFDIIGDNFEFALQDINNMSWKDSYVPTIPWEKESKMLFWEEQKNWLFFWAFCMARWKDLPQKIKKWEEKLSDIWFAKDEGIAEITHILYDPNLRILMIEYNHYWPRITTIRDHINFLIGNTWRYEPFGFNVRIDQSILERLNKMDAITLFECKVKSINSKEVWKLDSSLDDAIEAAKRLWEVELISIKLKSERWKILSRNVNWWFLYKIKKFISNKGAIETNNLFETLKVKWLSEEWLSEIDLLQQIIRIEKKIVKIWLSKTLDEKDLLNKMEDWYEKTKNLFN